MTFVKNGKSPFRYLLEPSGGFAHIFLYHAQAFGYLVDTGYETTWYLV